MLNVHAIERRGSRSLGPGLRYIIWVQGCPFNCMGCITPEARTVKAEKIYSIDSIANDIINSSCDGLTISGGEPFLQAAGLSKLLNIVHQYRPEMNVLVFTGFLKENLLSKDALNVLKHTDILIDGPYIESMNDGVGLRGSSNQRIHFISGKFADIQNELEHGKREIEISFTNEGIEAVGIPLQKTVHTKN